MARTILWSGRWTNSLTPIAAGVQETLGETVHPYTMGVQHTHMHGGGFQSIIDYLAENRYSIRPLDLLIIGLSTRDTEQMREQHSLEATGRVRAELDSLRFLNGRSGASVPILLTTEAMGGPQRPDTIAPNPYFMLLSHEFIKVTASLLTISKELFLGSLSIVGFSLVSVGDRLMPYIVAYDESFEGHDIIRLGNYGLTGGGLIADQVGGWFLLDGHLVRDLRNAIDEFEELVNRRDLAEMEIHDFFLRHPEFLYRNEFNKIWHEPRLQIPKELSMDFIDNTVRPDFILGRDGPDDPLCLVEVKLPDVPLLVSNARQMSAKVTAGISQLRRYKRYFADASTVEERRRVLGSNLAYPRCLLLIGRLPKGRSAKTALERVREDELPGIHLLTYDEVIEFQRQRIKSLVTINH
jgi:Domain of unknown function (DUF4263)